jgi:hypothetical protein
MTGPAQEISTTTTASAKPAPVRAEDDGPKICPKDARGKLPVPVLEGFTKMLALYS